MTIKNIQSMNSTVLPPKKKILEIDLNTNVGELKKHLRDEFDLPNLNFTLFLKSSTKSKEKSKGSSKWYLIEGNAKPLSDFPFDGEKLRLDIKRAVSLDEIRKLKDTMEEIKIVDYPYGVLHVENIDEELTRKKLVEVTLKFMEEALRDPSNVAFSIPSRSGDNIGFDELTELVLLGKQRTARQFRNLSSVKSVQQLTQLMTIIHEVLERGIDSTKRDIFYQAVNEFENQSTSDNLIEDMGAMLRVTRSSLNVTASAKGIVVGHLKYTEGGDQINGEEIGLGKSIPPNINDIDNLESDAEFVLVIEKDAIFNRLTQDRFYDYIPSILITAKGQPDMATRMFLKKIDEELKLPILAIMDADIYGFEILRVYSVGSKALSFEAANLAVPNIKWLGLLPSDLKEDSGFNIPSSTHIKMTKSDERRTKLLLEEEFVKRKPKWKSELEVLLDLGIKAEIQAMNAKDPQYITNHYLPEKIESGSFI